MTALKELIFLSKLNLLQMPINCESCTESMCTTCAPPNEYQLDGACLELCPLGFNLRSSICERSFPEYQIVNFEFQSISTCFVDKISSLIGVIKPENSQNNIGIYSSYQRGAYFTGQSFIEINLDSIVLLAILLLYLLGSCLRLI